MNIDRCLCYKRLFADLSEKMNRRGLSLEQVMQETSVGSGCGLCVPYLYEMRRTGQVAFDRIISEDEVVQCTSSCDGCDK
ncbi:hypothetical protein KS4_03360 [Poriferisphaera corsica]|uniref:(2Fe-2S)-binding protein n=1 Tax=Poriferisphaera corsica TaxID=2528020 RepID=A0A517YPZ5_9BACT|nr:(2Fe-2S)-binding protein [Poriferisphaera corsica]QDU32304.1 hypothetical protein KS4_03360 [Poriferisphaera corsica]